MTYASTAQRAELIKGLRALADYLETNPDIPAPSYADVYTFPPDGACDEMRAEIDIIAARLGSNARETADGSHYTVTRSFGPVTYRAAAICKHHHHNSKG